MRWSSFASASRSLAHAASTTRQGRSGSSELLSAAVRIARVRRVRWRLTPMAALLVRFTLSLTTRISVTHLPDVGPLEVIEREVGARWSDSGSAQIAAELSFKRYRL